MESISLTAGADLQSEPHDTGKARIANPRQHNKIVSCPVVPDLFRRSGFAIRNSVKLGFAIRMC